MYRGAEGLRAGMLDWLEPWDSYHAGVEDVIDAGHGRVLVLTRDRARPKGSDAEVSFLGAPVWTVRDGKVAASSSTGTALRAWQRQGWRSRRPRRSSLSARGDTITPPSPSCLSDLHAP